jgi:protein-tyrosine-phosphatase
MERRLHPRRHRRALEAVASREAVREVVFICLGNICRSPYAELRLRRHLEEAGLDERIAVRSAGFIGPGRPSPDTARLVAEERGLSLDEHRARVLGREHLRGGDLILVMTNRQQRDLRWRYGRPDTLHLGDLDPGPIPRRDILDPIEKPAEVFREVYARIDRAVGALAEELIAAEAAVGRREGRSAEGSDP